MPGQKSIYETFLVISHTVPVFLNVMGPRNRFQGMNSASLCSLPGRYDNPLPPRFLTPINSLKIPALYTMGLFQCRAEVGQKTFFKSLQKIANQQIQILGLPPLSQIHKFLGVPVSKSEIHKFLQLIQKSQIHKFSQNTAQLYLKTALKFVFLKQFFVLYQFELDHCMIRRKSMQLRTWENFKSANHKKYRVCKLHIHKVLHLRTVCASNKLFKSAYLRICYMRNFFADRPPVL
jgi:hypothetical protein